MMEPSTSKPKHFLKLLTSLVGALAVVLGVVVAPKLMVQEVSGDDIALSAAYDYPDNYVAPQPNNALPRECGINVAFVMDMSGSIGRLGKDKTQEAAKQMVAELAGSPVNVGLFNFATEAPVNGEDAQQTEPVSVFTDEGVNTLNTKIDNLVTGSYPNDGTNWEGALNNVEKANADYDVVFFITDGVPTTNGNKNSGYKTAEDTGTLTHNVDLSMAVEAANKLKAGGARIVPIAIGLDALPAQPVFKSYVDRMARTTITNGAKPHFDGYGYVGYDYYRNPFYYQDANGYIYDRVVHEVHASGAQWNTFFHSEDVLYYRTPQQMLDAVSGAGDTTYIQNYGELPQALVDQLRDLCKNSVLIKKVFQDEDGNEYSEISQIPDSIPRENFAEWDFTATNPNDPNFNLVDANGNQVDKLTQQATDDNGFKTLPYDFLNPGVDATGTVNIVESTPADSEFWSPGTLSNGKAAYCYESDTKREVPVETRETETGLVDFDVQIKTDKTIYCEVANKYQKESTSTTPTTQPTTPQSTTTAPNEPSGGLDIRKEFVSGDPDFTGKKFDLTYNIVIKNNGSTPQSLIADIEDQVHFPDHWGVYSVKADIDGEVIDSFSREENYTIGKLRIPKSTPGLTDIPAKEEKVIKVVVTGQAYSQREGFIDDTNSPVYECQAGEGDDFPENPTGFYNQVVVENPNDDSSENGNNYACHTDDPHEEEPQPDPTPDPATFKIEKKALNESPVLVTPGQEFEVGYEIVITNNSDQAASLNGPLVDKPSYPDEVFNTRWGAMYYKDKAKNEGFKYSVVDGTYSITSEEIGEIPANGTKSVFVYTSYKTNEGVEASDLNAQDFECNIVRGDDKLVDTPTGFYNLVEVDDVYTDDTDGVDNNEACVPIEVDAPKFEVEKLAESDTAVREGEGVYSAPYLVTVRNTSTVAAGNSGPVIDVPKPAKGYKIAEVTVDGAPADLNDNGEYVVSTGVDLDPLRSESFRVRVTYKEDEGQDSGNSDLGKCEDTTDGNPSQTGLANVVTLTNFDAEPKEDNDACVVLEKPNFKVAKENIGEGQVALNSDGTGEVQYKVTVTNNAAKPAMLPNPVIDNPDLPLGFTADEVRFELDGAENPIVVSSPEADSFTLNPEWFGLFEAGQEKRVTVTVKVRADKNVMGELRSGTTKYQCEDESTEEKKIPEPKGLFNSVSLLGENDVDDGVTNNYDCQEPVVPGWKVEKSAPEKGVLIEAGVKPELEYTVKVTNLGVQGSLENPVVDELTIPDGFDFEKADFALGENTESSNEQTYSLSPEFFGEFMAGETKEVKVTVTLEAPDAALADKVAENAEDYVCGVEEGEDGLPSQKTGFYNEVSLEGEVDGSLPKDNNHACITPEIDGFRVEKKADSDAVTVSKEPVDVTYTVVVTNKGKDAANLEAPVVEKPQVPAGFTLSEVSFAMDGATTKNFSGATLADTYELEPAWFGEFAGRESKTIKITMKVAAEEQTLDAIRENPQDFVCEDTSGLGDIPESFKGIANSVTLAGESEGLNPEHNNFDCVTPQVPAFETNKVVIGDGIAKKISGRDADGNEIPGIFAAKYKVDVVNNSMVPGNFGELFDVPNDVPGFNVVGVYAGDKSFALNKLEEIAGKYKLSSGEELAPGATRSFFVEVRYELLETATSEERMNASECAADNTGSFNNMGLENKVELETEPDTKEADNFACAKLPSFKMEKVAKSTAVQVTPGTTEVSYEISVTNNSAVRAGLLNDVIDTPVFPEGFTITAVRYNTPGAVELGRFTALYDADGNPTSQRLPASWFGTFEPNETKTVTATFTIDVAESVAKAVESDSEAFACEARDGATDFPPNKTGLYNQVTLVGEVDGDNPNGNNFDCITPTVDPVSELDIVKKINGADADTEAAAVAVAPGEDMLVTYRVTNTGTTDLYHISVNDEIIEGDVVPVDAQPQDKKYPAGATKESEGIAYDGMLKPGEYVIFEATVKAPAGDAALHHNVAKAGGVPPTEGGETPPPPGDGETPPVESTDDDGFAETPKLTVKKYINDDDAQDEPGVELDSGKDMRIKYVITNDSGVNLYHVGLTDDVVKHDNGDVDAVEAEINNRIVAAIEELKRDSLNPWSGHLMAGESITVEVTHPAPSANDDGKNALHSNKAVASGVPPLTPPDHPKPGEPGYEDPDNPTPPENFDPRDPRVPHPTPEDEEPPVKSEEDPGNGHVPPTDTPQTPPEEGKPSLKLEKLINGYDADTPEAAVPVKPGEDMTITYQVHNDSDANVYGIDITDKVNEASDVDELQKRIDEALAAKKDAGEMPFDLAAGKTKEIEITVTALEGGHTNTAFASGKSEDPDNPGNPDEGEDVPPVESNEDPGHTSGPSLELEKLINGYDADTAEAAVPVKPGEDMTITYQVHNDSDANVYGIDITDKVNEASDVDELQKRIDEALAAKKDAGEMPFDLAAGKTKEIEITVTALEGGHTNTAFASGKSEDPDNPGNPDEGENVPPVESNEDPGNSVESGKPAIDVEKLINGEDADTRESAVGVAPGSEMKIQFIVKNTGQTDLTNVKLTDDKVALEDIAPAEGYEQYAAFLNPEGEPGGDLAKGATAIFTAKYTAPELGNEFHVNTAKVTGQTPPPGEGDNPPADGDTPTTEVEDEDPAVAKTTDEPSLEIRKKVNGFDTSETDPAIVKPGEMMKLAFIVTNNGDTTINNITVTDDMVGELGVDLVSPDVYYDENGDEAGEYTGALAPGEYAVYTAEMPAPEGNGEVHHNVAFAEGEVPPPGGDVPPTETETSTPPTGTETSTPPTDGETPPTTGEVPPTDGETPPTTTGETPPKVTTPPDDGWAKTPSLSITKFINGEDANGTEDEKIPSVELTPGGDMRIHYLVHNDGDVVLNDVKVVDEVTLSTVGGEDNAEAKSALQDEIEKALADVAPMTLQPGEKQSIFITVSAPEGNDEKHSNVAYAEGVPPSLTPPDSVPGEPEYPTDGGDTPPVKSNEDPGNGYTPPLDEGTPPAPVGKADLTIDKKINGQDTSEDSPAAVKPGDDMTVTFLVANPGDAEKGDLPVTNIEIHDDKVAKELIKAPAQKTDKDGKLVDYDEVLNPGESALFTAVIKAPKAQPGMDHHNVAYATGEGEVPPPPGGETPPNPPKVKTPPDHGYADSPKFTLEKFINGHKADEPRDVKLVPGEMMTIAYEVTNESKVTISNITIKDRVTSGADSERIAADIKTALEDEPAFDLVPGESKTVTIKVKATETPDDQHTNYAKAVGEIPPPSDGDTPPGDGETPPGDGETPPGDGDTPPGDGENPSIETPEDPGNAYTPPKANPGIDVEKWINGKDADEAKDAVEVAPGSMMDIKFIVKNTGDTDLVDVTLTDDKVAAENIQAPEGFDGKLKVGETVIFSAELKAPEGSDQAHVNEATVTGNVPPADGENPPADGETPPTDGENPPDVSDKDKAHAKTPGEPKLVIRKKINGLDTEKDLPAIVRPGDDMLVSFIVTNVGTAPIAGVKVEDNVIPADKIVAPKVRYEADGTEAGAFDNILNKGEYAVFTATIPAPEAKEGMDHHNVANAVGFIPPAPADGGDLPPADVPEGEWPPIESDDDEGFAEVPTLEILKSINGEDANEAPGVEVEPGSDMAVTYTVTNTGEVALNDIKVEDEIIAGDNIGEVPADKIVAGEKKMTADGKEVPFNGTLLPGETVVFGAIIKAPEKVGKQHTNVAQAFGTPPANENGEEPKPGEPEYPTDGGEVPPVPSNEDPANAITDEDPGEFGGFNPPPWWPLIPLILIPLIPVFGGSSDGSSVPPSGSTEFPGSSEPGKPGSSQPGTATPGEPRSEAPGEDAPEQPEESNSVFSPLAETGASVIGLTLIAMLLMLFGLFLLRRKSSQGGRHSA